MAITRRDALKRQFAALFAAGALLVGCNTNSPTRDGVPPAAEKSPSDAQKPVAPETIVAPRFIVEEDWPAFLVYPEGFVPDQEISPEVERAWAAKVDQVAKEVETHPRFVQLKETGANPTVHIGVDAGPNEGKKYIFVSWTVTD